MTKIFQFSRRSFLNRFFPRLYSPSPILHFSSSASIPIVDHSHSDIDNEMKKFKASLDDQTRQKLETYMAEYEHFKSVEQKMPKHVSVNHWRRLLLTPYKADRILMLTFLHGNEKKYERTEENKERRRLAKQKEIEETSTGRKNSIFRHILDTEIKRKCSTRLAMAMMFSQPLVLDMSLIPILRGPREWTCTAKQLARIHTANRYHRWPFHLIFAGCNREHESWAIVDSVFDLEHGIDSGFHTVTDEYYADLFPREDLVYLSPDGESELTEYDPGKIYTVAACVDEFPKPKLTWRLAKELGIEVKRLPLEKEFIGRRQLCINHAVEILRNSQIHYNVVEEAKKTCSSIVEVIKKGTRRKRKQKRNELHLRNMEVVEKLL